MNFSKRVKITILILILLNLILGGVYYSVFKEINKNSKQTLNLTNDFNLQLAKERQLKSFKNVTDDTVSDREKLDSNFVSSDGTVSFIKEIENLAAVSNLFIEIGSVAVEDYARDGRTSEVVEILSMNFTTGGAWSDNFYFLNLIESMPYKITINDFSVNTNKGVDGKTLNWEGSTGIKVLKLK
ncbi:MAG TPA: hypothetical protein QGH03_02050 [Candidatus Paceibacterota bacterium]|jgi:hypothetical protein|nr:hypothetical protein [Candidatus Paceibacterota bacterium]HJN62991.1 hypothetical protein [Candidatus Paceibacterota bacterium]|tara:strand:+ start:1143 stop:1694 length:552 start_codon:yes stop_codon:yes gene_type:complete